MKARLKRIFFLPKRLMNAILTPGYALVQFFTQLPEETPLAETVGDAISDGNNRLALWQSLMEHFMVLRKAILRSIIVLIFTTLIGFSFSTSFMSILAVPLHGESLSSIFEQKTILAQTQRLIQIGSQAMATLQVIEPTEAIEIFMRVSLLAGVALAMPWFVLELYLFIAPGLMPRTRLIMVASIPVATGMFLSGMAFCYLLMLPTAVPFLRDFMFFRFAWRPSAYFDLVTSLMFWIGLVFEMPLAVYALALIGWVRARDLAQYWKFAVAGIAVLAAVITPTPDPVNMTIVMIPLFFLYGVSILVAFVGQKSAARRQPSDLLKLQTPD